MDRLKQIHEVGPSRVEVLRREQARVLRLGGDRAAERVSAGVMSRSDCCRHEATAGTAVVGRATGRVSRAIASVQGRADFTENTGELCTTPSAELARAN